MSADQINQIFHLLYTYSYLVLFPLIVFEGPIVTIIAGFLVSVGFMDLIPSYLTIISADLTGDVLYYSSGRWLINRVYKKLLAFLNIKMSAINKIERAIRRNKGRVLFFGKLSHAIGGIILFAAGSAKVPFKDFLWFNFLATLPKSLILLAVGYYFGNTVGSFNKYLNLSVIGLLIITLTLIGLYIMITYFSKRFITKIEHD